MTHTDSLSGARVLITGGAGFIGSHLTEHLLRRGARVVVLDDLTTGTAENLPRHPRLELVRGSVMDPASLSGAGGADLVFHLAAVVGMRLAARHRELAFELADVGTRNVIECSGSAALVLLSSSSVYAHASTAGAVDEDDVAPPEELLALDGGVPGYASGKWRLEEHGRAAAAAGRRVLLVRPFNVVGPRQTGRYGMVLPTLVKSALRGEPLTVFDDGDQSRCFSHVHTFVRTLASLAERQEGWGAGGMVVNVGADRPTRIGELSRMVLEETESTSAVTYVDYQSVFPGRRDVRARVPDTRRCAALIGAVDWPDTRAIVRDVVSWARSECAPTATS
ncbi:MAG TPA: NAD-dependent epimerase/dehydratase family protein [Longimicrobium sp.]|nr:NAD-dependent epimerase/dehydratase family protein [Longimicrobium sp.]